MKEETVRQMELTRRDANTVYQNLCRIALDIADVALHAKEGNTQADMDDLLTRYEAARADWQIAFAKEQAALLRWQNEFDRRERIVS